MHHGKYDLTAVPRFLFASDGKMYKIQAKSKLMHHLEELSSKELTTDILNTSLGTSKSAVSVKSSDSGTVIIDGMPKLHTLIPSKDTKTVADLADQFSQKILIKYNEYSEIHIIFDTYFEKSLKNATRERRQHGNAPVICKVEDEYENCHNERTFIPL